MESFDLDRIFDYHAPDDFKKQLHETIRQETKMFTGDILDMILPQSDAQSDEARQFVFKMQEAMFYANAAVARPNDIKDENE